jgi:hypothetical protein
MIPQYIRPTFQPSNVQRYRWQSQIANRKSAIARITLPTCKRSNVPTCNGSFRNRQSQIANVLPAASCFLPTGNWFSLISDL